MINISFTPATIRHQVSLNASPLQAQKTSARPQFSGNKLFGTEDKFGKKHWSINLTGLPLIDRALAYVTIPFVAALGLPTAHNYTPGGQNLTGLTTAYRQVAQVDDDQTLSPELTASMQQEKFRGFISEFNRQVAANGKVDASTVLGRFPTFTPEDVLATQQIINAIPDKGTISDVIESVEKFKTEVLAKHYTPDEIARFSEAATLHLNSLQTHENINAAASFAAIIAAGIGVGLIGIATLAVASIFKNR